MAGNVALISRGNCTFFDKSALARKAGAAAAVIYNDVAGQIRGLNLGADNSTADRVVPTIGISRANGLGLVQKLSNSTSVGATFNVRSFIESIPTYVFSSSYRSKEITYTLLFVLLSSSDTQ